MFVLSHCPREMSKPLCVARRRDAVVRPRPVDISCKNTSDDASRPRTRVSFILGKTSVQGYPPSPYPPERLDWRGFCKKPAQIIDGKGLRCQNLDNKELAGLFGVTPHTAFALAIICFLPV